jgi:DNA-directed RNA polymerase specialized sigma24 family protein
MKKGWVLTEEAFTKFLTWLHPEREKAGEKYEAIRRRLVIIFTCKGCAEAEDLADETINRVIHRSQQMIETYDGEPTAYFVTVAHNLYLEHAASRPLRSELPDQLPQPEDCGPDDDREYECLDKCIERLAPNNRSLVLGYYQETKQAKIDHRKKLAEELGIGINALRIRAHRVRAVLQECIDHCLNNQSLDEMD